MTETSRASAAREPASPAEPRRATHRARWLRWIAAVVIVLVYAGTTWVRVRGTLEDPGFDVEDPAGLMKSDPGLALYVTEKLVEAGGWPPADFRRDPGPCWPEPADLPAMFAVGKEFVVAWARQLAGERVPLHVFAAIVMSFVASLALVGVVGLTWELTHSVAWCALAAALHAVLPYDYRTVGLVLQDEDLALPLYAAHLWLALRAARTDGVAAWAGAGLALALAYATWHATGFFVNLEVAALWVVLLRTGEQPLRSPRSGIAIAILVASGFLVPVLLAKRVLLTPGVLGLVALFFAARIPIAREGSRARRAGVALAVLAGVLALGQALVRVGLGNPADYRHVTSFLAAKLANLGRLPHDPSELPFDVRLLWQGPFVTATRAHFQLGFGPLGVWLVPVLAVRAGWLWLRGRAEPRELVVHVLFAGSLVAAWLVERTLILPALLLPVLVATLGARRRGWVPYVVAIAVLVTQGAWFLAATTRTAQTWYQPVEYTRELRHLVRWADASLPRDEGVLGDFVASTALLAESRIPIVLQPKYETDASRRRIERFYTTFARGSLDELAELMREWRCRFLLIDCRYLWSPDQRYIMGIPREQTIPARGTPAWHFLHRKQEVLESVPGFQLLYRSPAGLGRDTFRVFRLER